MSKQCGTCNYAAEFCYPSSPGGPTDGVHCTSEDHAKIMDEQTSGNAGAMAELKEFGFLDLWRLEFIAEGDYECPNWAEKEAELEQVRKTIK